MDWWFIGGIAAGASFLIGRSAFRRKQQDHAANAAGLSPIDDLSHVSTTLQRTALWCLADGGFERRVLHGNLARDGGDVDVTAFDLETLRVRRGEWAWLPVEPAFRIGDVVSVVAATVDRKFPHVLLKHAGVGDELRDASLIERGLPLHPGDNRLPKLWRDMMGMKRGYEAEMPNALPPKPLEVAIPDYWRAYSEAADYVGELVTHGLGKTLEAAHRRDLVIELLDAMVVVYPANREVADADAMADLTTTALSVVDGVLACSRAVTPRGMS